MKFVFVVAIVIAVVRIAILRAKRADEAWQSAGRRLGLEVKTGGVFGGRRLTGERDGFEVRIDTFTRRVGRGSASYSRYSIGFEPLGLELAVKRRGPLSGVARLLADRDVLTGDRTFDAAFAVRGSRPDAVRRFLTPERRATLERAFQRFRKLVITDARLLFVRRGTDGEERLVGTVDALCALARELGAQPAVTNLARASAALAEAPLAAVAQAASVQRRDGSYREGRDAGARDAVAPTVERPLPTLVPEPQEPEPLEPEPLEPEPLEPEPLGESAAEACAALFVPGRMSGDLVRAFDERYAGRLVRWRGELQRVETYYSDSVFGAERGARASLKIHTIEGAGLGAGDVLAVVQLPLAAAEELGGHAGETFELRGRLVRCDPYMRRLFVADGAVGG